MKRATVYAVTAAAALSMTGVMSGTAEAAVNTYNFSAGNGKVIMITGNNGEELKNILNRLPGGSGLLDCLPGYPNHPDNSLPSPEFPTPELPSSEFPTPELPSPEFPTPELPSPDRPSDGTMDEVAGTVWKLVNEERAKAGLAPLEFNSGAAHAAQTRAKEIETVFSHTRPDGSSFTTALTEAGVKYKAAGENIAYGQKTAQQVMQDWMNSSGHRANILNGSYTSIGIGHYKSASGADYWTQIFMN